MRGSVIFSLTCLIVIVESSLGLEFTVEGCDTADFRTCYNSIQHANDIEDCTGSLQTLKDMLTCYQSCCLTTMECDLVRTNITQACININATMCTSTNYFETCQFEPLQQATAGENTFTIVIIVVAVIVVLVVMYRVMHGSKRHNQPQRGHSDTRPAATAPPRGDDFEEDVDGPRPVGGRDSMFHQHPMAYYIQTGWRPIKQPGA
eukprot:766203-Hanusia_phi.AAC.6